MSERTSLKYFYYALKLYPSGLSLRRTSQHLSLIIKRNHVSVWNWIQKYKPKKIFQKGNKIQGFIVDETLIKVSNDFVWIWVANEPIDKVILDCISFERTMLVGEQFLKGLVKKYGKHSISTDGATWYPQACKFLKITQHKKYYKCIIRNLSISIFSQEYTPPE
jgi:putative transposase